VKLARPSAPIKSSTDASRREQYPSSLHTGRPRSYRNLPMPPATSMDAPAM
jgi:hypothetical protein